MPVWLVGKVHPACQAGLLPGLPPACLSPPPPSRQPQPAIIPKKLHCPCRLGKSVQIKLLSVCPWVLLGQSGLAGSQPGVCLLWAPGWGSGKAHMSVPVQGSSTNSSNGKSGLVGHSLPSGPASRLSGAGLSARPGINHWQASWQATANIIVSLVP